METNIEFYELEKRVYRLVCNLGCEIIKRILEVQDEQIMNNRNKKEYRHKGYKGATIKTIMGEVEYKRAIYKKDKDYVFLLDDNIKVGKIGDISQNLVETMLKTVVNTVSYRKAEQEIKSLTNITISHQALKQLVWKVGRIIEAKEKEEIKLHKQEKLIKGTKEIPALFEEADGLWIRLQGKDRKIVLEKYKKECEKKNKEFNPKHRCKTELKLHITYEGWNKDSKRHELVNKKYIAGIMTSQTLKKLKNARIHQQYNIDSIELRAMNGDGANWIENIATKDTIVQKDSFHIQQEIVRDIKNEKYRQGLIKILEEKRYSEVHDYIEALKYELGGEEKTVKKLKTLQSYLKNGLPRYQDILKEQNRELPKAPCGIEYRNMGTAESQIFTVLEVRLCSGRKAFLKNGASYLAKVCAEYFENNGEIELQKIENSIAIDNSVEEWIREIEENVRKNKKAHRADRKLTEENNFAQAKILEYTPELKEVLKLAEPTALMYR
ncbi:MAG: hypothetical protein HFJ24_07495 [Clostridia bacterium]|nr:hypothetical protein [Clostridia bacterium]